MTPYERAVLTACSPEVWRGHQEIMMVLAIPMPWSRLLGELRAMLPQLVDRGLVEMVAGRWRRTEAGTAALMQREEVLA